MQRFIPAVTNQTITVADNKSAMFDVVAFSSHGLNSTDQLNHLRGVHVSSTHHWNQLSDHHLVETPNRSNTWPTIWDKISASLKASDLKPHRNLPWKLNLNSKPVSRYQVSCLRMLRWRSQPTGKCCGFTLSRKVCRQERTKSKHLASKRNTSWWTGATFRRHKSMWCSRMAYAIKAL